MHSCLFSITCDAREAALTSPLTPPPAPGASVTLCVGADGLHIARDAWCRTVPWSAFAGCEERDDRLVLRGAGMTLILSRRCLPSPSARAALLARLRGGWTSGSPGALDRSDVAFDRYPAARANPGEVLNRLARNLRAGIKAAAFRRVGLDDLSATPGQLIALAAIGLALQLLHDAANAGWQGQFNFRDVPRATAYLPPLLLAAWLIARMRRMPALLLAIPVLYCSLMLPYDLAFAALGWAADTEWLASGGNRDWPRWAWYALYAGWFLAAMAASARLAGASARRLRRWWHPALASLPLAILVALPWWFLPPASLWEGPQDEAGSEGDAYAVSREQIFYGQPALLDRTLAALAPQRPGVQDLYFVGAAGYASEDVFMKEIEVIGELMRSRFDTRSAAWSW
jgi:hypothetical protein